jgi:hypothetical protein
VDVGVDVVQDRGWVLTYLVPNAMRPPLAGNTGGKPGAEHVLDAQTKKILGATNLKDPAKIRCQQATARDNKRRRLLYHHNEEGQHSCNLC